MKLTIVTPEKTIYDGEAISVAVPGTKGAFEVLDNHAPIISSLQSGIITVKTADGVQEFTVRSGFIEVARNSVSICAEE
ncbi:MAG: ATP synthase F1 subunit epsilon [Bacteroidaceae bacterium]|nr:ATP synthase F1 subunit epsilon [Bacteroidaceae bacterium]MBR3634099.1 ATP synthase F1 subunit epsilon [Bacteroidaceae bacterium]MBR4648861.1 ATP synthase F1 subunit epsilon [Bacteroidaceae bacterium]